jgi:hypothetical protein
MLSKKEIEEIAEKYLTTIEGCNMDGEFYEERVIRNDASLRMFARDIEATVKRKLEETEC